MIFGAHVLFYSQNPEADRTFFRDVLGFRHVDAGEGWLIFALPPAEAAFHPSDGHSGQGHGGRELLGSVLYLMCDDLAATIKSLQAKKVVCSPGRKGELGREDNVSSAEWRRDWPLSAVAPHGHQKVSFLSLRPLCATALRAWEPAPQSIGAARKVQTPVLSLIILMPFSDN